MSGLDLELPGLGLGFYGKVSVLVSKFETGLGVGLGGYGLDYITGMVITSCMHGITEKFSCWAKLRRI